MSEYFREATMRDVPKAEPEPIGTYFAISQDVMKAMREVPVVTENHDNRTDLMCNICHHQVSCLALDNMPYIYTIEQLQGLLLSHLIQSHGWSREDVGEY